MRRAYSALQPSGLDLVDYLHHVDYFFMGQPNVTKELLDPVYKISQ